MLTLMECLTKTTRSFR